MGGPTAGRLSNPAPDGPVTCAAAGDCGNSCRALVRRPGRDLKCAPGKVWIQEFDRATHHLGYGPFWRTVSFDREPVTFSRVVFPPGF